MTPGLLLDALTVCAAIVAAVSVVRLLRAVGSTVRDVRTAAWADGVAHRDTFANPLAPGIAVVVPAATPAGVGDTVSSAQNVRYPDVRIVIVDGTADGSVTDATRAATDLGPARSVPVGIPDGDDVVESPDGMIAIGRPGEHWAGEHWAAAARGVELARRELLLVAPPGMLFDAEALLWAATPFIDDAAVTAVRGAVLPVEPGAVERGRLVGSPLPRHPYALLQVPTRLREATRPWGTGAVARSFAVVRSDVVHPRDAAVADATTGLARGARRGTTELVARRRRVPTAVAWSAAPRSLGGLLGATARAASARVATLRAIRARGAVLAALIADVLVPLAAVGALALGATAGAVGVIEPAVLLAGVAVAWALPVLASLVVLGGEVIALRRYGGAGPTILLALAALAAPLLVDPVEALGRLGGTLRGMTRRVTHHADHRAR